jgi:hypothetical protein
MSTGHISDHDLERYYMGIVTQEEELALQEHLLLCQQCVERASDTQDLIRRAIILFQASSVPDQPPSVFRRAACRFLHRNGSGCL